MSRMERRRARALAAMRSVHVRPFMGGPEFSIRGGPGGTYPGLADAMAAARIWLRDQRLRFVR